MTEESKYMASILQYIHNAEERAISQDYNVTGVQKKQWVITEIRRNMPYFYSKNLLLIDTVIDSMILIGNNPAVILAGKKVKESIFNCCN